MPSSVKNPDAVAKVAELLELIFDGLVFDPGISYLGNGAGMKKFFYIISSGIIKTGEGNFASWYAQHGPTAEAELADFLAKAAEIK